MGVHGIEQPEARHDAEDRQRNREHDDQRDSERAGLGHQQDVNPDHGRTEGQTQIAEYVERDLPLPLAGKVHLEARRQTPGDATAV